MKKLLLSAVLAMATLQTFAQKLEVTVHATTNVYHYAGDDARSTSFLLEGTTPANTYTNDPYGSKSASGFGVATQAQYVTKVGFIAGLQAGYERVKSNIVLESFYLNGTSPRIATSGNTYLKSDYINLNPYIGYRVALSKISIDLMPGMDIGFKTQMREEGTATDGTTTLTSNREREDKKTDLRLRFGIAANYNRFGITANYAHGLTNFKAGLIGGPAQEAYSRLWRFGVSYRIF